jgi:hypothetical protein
MNNVLAPLLPIIGFREHVHRDERSNLAPPGRRTRQSACAAGCLVNDGAIRAFFG